MGGGCPDHLLLSSGSGEGQGQILQRFPEKDWEDNPFPQGIELVSREPRDGARPADPGPCRTGRSPVELLWRVEGGGAGLAGIGCVVPTSCCPSLLMVGIRSCVTSQRLTPFYGGQAEV